MSVLVELVTLVLVVTAVSKVNAGCAVSVQVTLSEYGCSFDSNCVAVARNCVGVTFGNGVACGYTYSSQTFSSPPIVQWTTALTNKYYTIIMASADPYSGWYWHYMLYAVSGSSLQSGASSSSGYQYSGFGYVSPAYFNDKIQIHIYQEENSSPNQPSSRYADVDSWMYTNNLCYSRKAEYEFGAD